MAAPHMPHTIRRVIKEIVAHPHYVDLLPRDERMLVEGMNAFRPYGETESYRYLRAVWDFLYVQAARGYTFDACLDARHGECALTWPVGIL